MAPGQDDFFRYFCRDRGSFCYSTLSVYAAVCRGDFISDDRIYGWTSVLYGNLAALSDAACVFGCKDHGMGKHVFGIRDSAGTRRNQGLF